MRLDETRTLYYAQPPEVATLPGLRAMEGGGL